MRAICPFRYSETPPASSAVTPEPAVMSTKSSCGLLSAAAADAEAETGAAATGRDTSPSESINPARLSARTRRILANGRKTPLRSHARIERAGKVLELSPLAAPHHRHHIEPHLAPFEPPLEQVLQR